MKHNSTTSLYGNVLPGGLGSGAQLTHQHPLAGPDPDAVRCAGGKLGPVAELAVFLAGQLAGLRERRHGARKLQTRLNVGLRTVLLPT